MKTTIAPVFALFLACGSAGSVVAGAPEDVAGNNGNFVAPWLRPVQSAQAQKSARAEQARIDEESAAAAADVAALVPMCLTQSKTDPDKVEQLAWIDSALDRRAFVMTAGWATIPQEGSGNLELAEACANALATIR